ncbi:hypothetical protein PEC302107_29760 [Pectobacterium araliae]|nr:hypothetical protein PEC302107_29760 [Pectobacterium carotovorum subsp. carotovorum]
MVGVGVSVPLISRESHSDNIAAAKSAEMQVNHLEADMRQNLEVLVETTWRDARQALEEFNSLLSTQKLAKENVQLRNKAFTQGMSTSLDVVDALNNQTFRFKVSYVSVMGISQRGAQTDTRQGFDIRTFEVEARRLHDSGNIVPADAPGQEVYGFAVCLHYFPNTKGTELRSETLTVSLWSMPLYSCTSADVPALTTSSAK